MAKNLDYSRSGGSERTGKVVQAGLVEQVDDGYYQITERGGANLAGELDAGELEN